jgi:type IV pilus assembly protein PilY1
MELDITNGGQFDHPLFDLNGDGVFDSDDLLDHDGDTSTAELSPSGKKSKSGILQQPSILIDKQGKKEFKYSSGSKKGAIERTVENPVPFDKGRKGWIQLK